MKYIFLILLFILLFDNCYSQLYHRIPKYEVHDIIYEFIYNNHLNNCFQHLQEDNLLYLKCWKNNMLYDVEIIAKPYQTFIGEFSLSINI